MEEEKEEVARKECRVERGDSPTITPTHLPAISPNPSNPTIPTDVTYQQ